MTSYFQSLTSIARANIEPEGTTALSRTSSTPPAIRPGNALAVRSLAQEVYDEAIDKNEPPLEPIYQYLRETGWSRYTPATEALRAYHDKRFQDLGAIMLQDGNWTTFTTKCRQHLETLVCNERTGPLLISRGIASFGIPVPGLLQSILADDYESFFTTSQAYPYVFNPPQGEEAESFDASHRAEYFTRWKQTFLLEGKRALKKDCTDWGLDQGLVNYIDHTHIPYINGRLTPKGIEAAISVIPFDNSLGNVEIFTREEPPDRQAFVIAQYIAPKGVKFHFISHRFANSPLSRALDKLLLRGGAEFETYGDKRLPGEYEAIMMHGRSILKPYLIGAGSLLLGVASALSGYALGGAPLVVFGAISMANGWFGAPRKIKEFQERYKRQFPIVSLPIEARNNYMALHALDGTLQPIEAGKEMRTGDEE